jgi:NTE family protein
MPITTVKYLALGIGSIRGVALLGAYEQLVQLGLQSLDGVAGASVGAIIGLCIVIGLTPKEMHSFLDLFISNEGKRMKFRLGRGCDKFSFFDSEPLRMELHRLLSIKHFTLGTTFQQLFDQTKKDYRVIAYSMKNKDSKTFSKDKTPDVSVVEAIMASSAIPYVFRPVQTDNQQCYMDGSVSVQIPFYEFPVESTLGLYLFDAYRSRKVAHQFFPALTPSAKDQIISIDVSRVKNTYFQLTHQMKAWLLQQGQSAVSLYYR